MRSKDKEDKNEEESIGTVGSVAMDESNNVPAATSTGGLTKKVKTKLEIRHLLEQEHMLITMV